MTQTPNKPPELGGSRDMPVRVISLLVRHQEKVLMGVRTETPFEKRHPGVLSTMTMAVTPGVFDLLEGGPLATWRDGIEPLEGQPSFWIGKDQHGLEMSAFVVEHLLSRKVGLADAIVDQRFRGEGRAVSRALDNVPDPQGTNESEWTAMLTYAVDLSAGANEVPRATVSYDQLIWVHADRVSEAVRRHDALYLDDTLDPIRVCLSGLCVRSAAVVLE